MAADFPAWELRLQGGVEGGRQRPAGRTQAGFEEDGHVPRGLRKAPAAANA